MNLVLRTNLILAHAENIIAKKVISEWRCRHYAYDIVDVR